MRKATFRDLTTAVGEFSQLSGRPIASKFLQRVIAEGEYKSDLTDPNPIPDFLRRTSTSPEQQAVVDDIVQGAAKARERNKPKPAKPGKNDPQPEVSERVLTKSECLEALNRMGDLGWVRAEVQNRPTGVQYTFIHHSRDPVDVVVERVGSGFRLTGADRILSENNPFDGAPMVSPEVQAQNEQGDPSDPVKQFKRKNVQGLYGYHHFEHPDGSFVQFSDDPSRRFEGTYHDKRTGDRTKFTDKDAMLAHIRQTRQGM